MALAFKISKAKFDALSDELKGEYIAGDKDGEYVLDVNGLPEAEDTGPIKRARDAEKNKANQYKAKIEELEAKIAEFPDVEALKTQHAAEVKKYKDFTEASLIDGAALTLATKISKSPQLILPHIKARLVADMTGDKPVTKVLGADGKPGDLTIDKLGEEFVANKDFATIMIGSKASGGGAPSAPVKPLGGGAPKDGEQANVDLSRAPAKDLVARIQERKAAAQAQ
jgi:hypothetical protein